MRFLKITIWDWLDVIGRLLILFGIILQLDMLAWFREVEVDAYLFRIVENQADIMRALANSDAGERQRNIHHVYQIEDSLRTAKSQRVITSTINISLMVVGTLLTVIARVAELRRQADYSVGR